MPAQNSIITNIHLITFPFSFLSKMAPKIPPIITPKVTTNVDEKFNLLLNMYIRELTKLIGNITAIAVPCACFVCNFRPFLV